MNFGEKLAKARKDQGLTQLELAEILGVSRQAISKWESETAVPGIDNLIALRKTLGVSLDYLLIGEAQPPAREQDTEANPELKAESFHKDKHLRFTICFSAVVLALAIVVSAMILHNRRAEDDMEIVPMENVSVQPDGNGYPTETFVIK